ncbi:endoplasmic reticulum membrane sensor NFE2L1-like isoform X2 [Myxocyprinus asiaticus]|uniref:endoplasmic reticulum membrane sensor NFE2L1-like isoform X2 n=1 Tax=Myxocyprinus asiaticus TaxID=70543 RepID=UPI00222350F0|nr:endoplasmic reticulum membrane sensor NFE2L1-like isoform X2 [Myxocyprinus asiaticus]
MLDLKKYFTEGLIQVAILLSLAGMRVDVDPYLPPLCEIIQGPSLAITQTQLHNLQNILDGYNVHPKSIDLDGLFTARRLLSWVRSLDHLQVPAAELEAWLFHSEPENGVSIPAQIGLLEQGGGLENVEDTSDLSMRLGSGGELGYVLADDETLETLGHMSRGLNHSDLDDINIEEGDDMSSLWEQGPQQNIHQDQLENVGIQPLTLFDEEEEEEEEDEFMVDGWRNANSFHIQMFGEEVQLTGPDVQNVEAHTLQVQRPLISPLLPEQESTFSLEQQWQDVLAIMESQDMNTAKTMGNSALNMSESDRNIGSMENFIHQDVSLHQATLSISSEGPSTNSIMDENSMQNFNFLETSSNVNVAFENSDIIDLLLTPGTNSSINSTYLPTLFEQQSLQSPLNPLLEEAMLDEIGLMDLALERISQAQLSQFEEQNQADSDSGLSMDYSRSPTSPSGSMSSSSSSSSSCSSSPSSPSPGLMPEEGAVGYTHIKEEEGAVGGYMPEQTKMCHTSYLEARQFHRLPWLEHIGHDHTYNQPQSSSQKKSPKQPSVDPFEEKKLEHLSSRDEKHARAMNIPFPIECIINLPVDKFNELLAKCCLNEAQLTLIRDIRRRGKNKMAAQNCRRRKLDNLLGLEHSVDGLRRHHARLLREKSEISRSLREIKRCLNSLYQEVYERLREEQGLLYSDNFTLQQDSISPVTHISQRRLVLHSKHKLGKRQKDKK